MWSGFPPNPKMTKNPQQAIILETLYTSLHSPHAEIRARAADALSQMGHLSTAVAAEHQIENHLLTAVADPSPIVRQHVATALGRIGSNAVIPALRNLLGDPVPEVRSSAVVSIGEIGGDPVWLLPLLQDPVAKVKASAAKILGEIGISNSVVISTLLKLLGDEDQVVGSSAAIALSKMNDSQVLPALLEVIKQDLPGRWNGAIALGYLGNETAVDALMGLLQDPEIRVRECVIEALGKIGSRRSLEPVGNC
jgi:HEAT repeat protein